VEDTDLDDFAAPAGRRRRERQRVGVAGGLDEDVDRRLEPVGDSFGRDRASRAEFPGERESVPAVGVRSDDGDRTRAAGDRHDERADADRAGAGNRDAIAGFETRSLDPVDS